MPNAILRRVIWELNDKVVCGCHVYKRPLWFCFIISLLATDGEIDYRGNEQLVETGALTAKKDVS